MNSKCKVRFTLTHGIGWCRLTYYKDVDLPFSPSSEFRIVDEEGDYNVSFDLKSNELREVCFHYDMRADELNIEVRFKERWGAHNRHEILDRIDSYNALGWTTDMSQEAIHKYVENYSVKSVI